MRMRLGTGWKLPLTLMLLLGSACSESEPEVAVSASASAADDGEGISAAAYLTELCDAQQAWLQDLQALNADLQEDIADPANVQELKDATLDYFDGVVAVTEDMVAVAEAAGVPDVDNGEEAAAAVVDVLERVTKAIRDARDRVAELETDDPAAFSSELLEISGDMGSSLEEVASAMDSFESAELDAAALDVTACQQVPA
jgi:phage-related tail protein